MWRGIQWLLKLLSTSALLLLGYTTAISRSYSINAICCSQYFNFFHWCYGFSQISRARLEYIYLHGANWVYTTGWFHWPLWGHSTWLAHFRQVFIWNNLLMSMWWNGCSTILCCPRLPEEMAYFSQRLGWFNVNIGQLLLGWHLLWGFSATTHGSSWDLRL